MQPKPALHILRKLHDDRAWETIEADRKQRPVLVLLLQEAVNEPPRDGIHMVACRADWEKHGKVHPHDTADYEEIVDLIDKYEVIKKW